MRWVIGSVLMCIKQRTVSRLKVFVFQEQRRKRPSQSTPGLEAALINILTLTADQITV